jgi:hypothetical protein
LAADDLVGGGNERVEVAMRLRHLTLGFLIAIASALPARAQSDFPGTWSTDPACGARALRVTFGANTLAIERNGRSIYQGGAVITVADDLIAVRLLPRGGEPGDSTRGVIRFGRAAGSIRMVAATAADGTAHYARVPPLYPCRAPATEAAVPAVLQSSAAIAPAR